MSSSIKFKHGADLEIELSNTSLSHAFQLGALLHTRQNNWKDPVKFATDKPGLKKAIDTADQLINFLNISVSTLGKTVVYLNKDEVNDSDLESLAWLIAGLSDLGADAQFARSEMIAALEKL